MNLFLKSDYKYYLSAVAVAYHSLSSDLMSSFMRFEHSACVITLCLNEVLGNISGFIWTLN